MASESGRPATVAVRPPRTERGRKTLRAMLDAAAAEFGERGFHDASIARITGRAGVALGTFYTYFDSKEAVFRALVHDMSGQVRAAVVPHILDAPDRLTGERLGLTAFLDFVRDNKSLYRILDEAEFVDPASWRAHYEGTVAGYVASLKAAAGRGEVRGDVGEIHAWAIVGMNVFLGLRYGVWQQDEATDRVAGIANALLVDGLKP